jgi:hypothetical protein
VQTLIGQLNVTPHGNAVYKQAPSVAILEHKHMRLDLVGLIGGILAFWPVG